MYLSPVQIAEAVHELRRVLMRLLGEQPYPPWAECEPWMRASTVASVESAIADPGWTPEQEHMRWLFERLAQGWSWGEVRDEDRKKNPAMVPYGQLPFPQRLKDTVSQAVIMACLKAG